MKEQRFRLHREMLQGREVQPVDSADMADCCHSQGTGCRRRIHNDQGAACQGRGSDSLKPLFVWEEKGSLWLVTWETE